MSANKGIETKIHDDENPESGYIEQESSEWEAHEESEETSHDRKVSSELDKLTNPDSGVSLEEARKATSDLEKLINPDSGVGLDEARNVSCEFDDDLTNPDSGVDLEEKLQALHVDSDTKPPVHITPAHERTDKDLPPIVLFFQQDNDGDTQLHIAAVHGCEKSVGTLIRLCPVRYLLDLPNDYGHTALHLAVMSGHHKIARMLVLAGASIGVRDLNGNTPIHAATAVSSTMCLQALLYPVDSQRKSKELVDSQHKSLLNIINYNGQTCVHIAANSGHLDTLKTLVSLGADVNAMEGYAGWTALHIAAHRGDLDLLKFLARECRGVSKRARDYACRTPRRLARRVHTLSMDKKQKIFDILPEESDSDTDDDDEYDSDDGESLFEKLKSKTVSAPMVN